MPLQKITPFLWFDHEAQKAAEFYTSVFPNSKILHSNQLVTSFELEGFQISAINGGPKFKLDEAFSLVISCNSKEEIDYYWKALTLNGEESMCGWLKDQFDLSWQVVPSFLPDLMIDSHR